MDSNENSELSEGADSNADSKAEDEAAFEAPRTAENSSPRASGRRSQEISLDDQESIARHLERFICELRRGVKTPVFVMLSHAYRVDGDGHVRPSRTGFLVEEFVEFFDFPLFPAELAPHLPDGYAKKPSASLVRAVGEALRQHKDILRQHTLVTAGGAAQRVWRICAEEKLPHVPHPCRWHMSCDDVYDKLCGASAVFKSRVSCEEWERRVHAAYNRYAAIQERLLPQEVKAARSRKIVATHAAMPAGEKAAINAKRAATLAAMPAGERAAINAKCAATRAARPQQVKDAVGAKLSAKNTQRWAKKSLAERKACGKLLRDAREATMTPRKLLQVAGKQSEFWRAKFVKDIDALFARLQEGSRLSREGRDALRKRWHVFTKRGVELSPDVQQKFKQLLMSDREFSKSSGAPGVLSPSARLGTKQRPEHLCGPEAGSGSAASQPKREAARDVPSERPTKRSKL